MFDLRTLLIPQIFNTDFPQAHWGRECTSCPTWLPSCILSYSPKLLLRKAFGREVELQCLELCPKPLVTRHFLEVHSVWSLAFLQNIQEMPMSRCPDVPIFHKICSTFQSIAFHPHLCRGWKHIAKLCHLATNHVILRFSFDHPERYTATTYYKCNCFLPLNINMIIKWSPLWVNDLRIYDDHWFCWLLKWCLSMDTR